MANPLTHPPITIVDLASGEALPHAADLEALLREYHGAVAFRVPGRDSSRARVVTTLLHGNEPSGARAIATLLATGIEPAVDSLLVLGALEAASALPLLSHRFLAGRLDRNRVFGPERLAHSDDDPDYAFANALLELIGGMPVEALIDVHNNTGHNPAYGIATRVDAGCLGLVALFADRSIVTDLDLHTLMEATDGPFPSVSIEVGRAGDPAADAVALDGIRRYLEADALEPLTGEMTLYSAPIRVELAPGATVAFSASRLEGPDIVFSDEIDKHNFNPIAGGTELAWVNSDAWPLRALDAGGRDISPQLFAIEANVLRPRDEIVPIMMTLDDRVARQDCLFYVVKNLR